MAETARYKLTVAYCGTRYFGWQIQGISNTWKGPIPADGKLPTVQGTLSKAIASVVGHPVSVVGSSRTDSGVHAKGQVCHMDTTSTHIPLEGLRRAVNNRMPGDIVIRRIEPAARNFDAIFDAVHKRYQYLIWHTYDRNVFKENLAFHRWQELDFDAMRAAAPVLVGTHDFTSFANPAHRRESTIRTVTGFDISRRGNLIVMGVSGKGFLWNQIRIMAGTLVEVGLGRFTPEDVRKMLEAKDRRAAGSTAPPYGLYLQWIEHREGHLDRGNTVAPVDDE